MSLPVEPLAHYIEMVYPDCHFASRENREHGNVGRMLAGITGVTSRTIDRIIYRSRAMVSISTVDEVCAALSIHPALIYGRAWTHRVCSRCGEEKTLDSFNLRGNTYTPFCKDCYILPGRAYQPPGREIGRGEDLQYVA